MYGRRERFRSANTESRAGNLRSVPWNLGSTRSVKLYNSRVSKDDHDATRNASFEDHKRLDDGLLVGLPGLTVPVALIDSEKSYPTPGSETHER
jgi:hypothetical protein